MSKEETVQSALERTTVYATAASKYHKVGQEINVGLATAANLIAKGYATAKPGKKD